MGAGASHKTFFIIKSIGLPLLAIAAYIGYEVYTFNVELNATMQGLGKAVVGVSEILSAFSNAVSDSTTIDSTQVLTDSLLIE